MTSKEKLEELRQEYKDALREGRTEDATAAFNKLRGKEVSEEPDEPEDSEEPEVEEEPEDYPDEELAEWEAISGVGPELAETLYNRFGPIEEFDPEEDDLEEVPGIGASKAESILEQL